MDATDLFVIGIRKLFIKKQVDERIIGLERLVDVVDGKTYSKEKADETSKQNRLTEQLSSSNQIGMLQQLSNRQTLHTQTASRP